VAETSKNQKHLSGVPGELGGRSINNSKRGSSFMLNLPNISDRFSGGVGIKMSSGNGGGVGGNICSGDNFSAHSGNSKNLFRRRLEN